SDGAAKSGKNKGQNQKRPTFCPSPNQHSRIDHATEDNRGTMQKIDHKKELKHLYNPSTKEVAIVDVPEMRFLMIDGEGDPNRAPTYAEAVEALYALAYTLKFMVKKGAAVNH